MLLIAYRPHDLSKITVAPYLIPITRELEDVKVGELLSMVHAKFAESLSPFVSKRHLQLLLKNG